MSSFEVPASAPGLAPVVVITDSLEKPSLDDRDYRVIRLDNELEALIVHDPVTDKASAALDVRVGAFSDEDDMPGMAHAVEHALFMGTKKFPVENDYSQYLSANSGSSNAYTASTSTNYFFDVAAKPSNDQEPTEDKPSPLRGALDRFAQFFIEPLFLANTLDRELQAVNSENKKNLQNDGWRLAQLEKTLSNPKHPFHHFSTGNLETLKEEPEARGINVRDKFMEFHDKHYSANRMKLVVLGREPLDVLQKWVEEFFSDVVNKKLPQNRWESEVPFRAEELGTQCFAKPVMDMRQLDFTFPFIDEELLYESQPGKYISHLIGHEGPGSIMAYIKSKGWAYSLSAGAYPICPGTAGHFEIQIRLTEEGLKHYTEIVNVVFQYISLLRDSPPQKWIFEEQKEMSDVDFKFRQKSPAERFTSRTASSMQGPIPREWLLSGSSVLRSFDPSAIERALAQLCPEKLRLGLVSREFPGNWDQKEKWYGTEYRYEKIPTETMNDFKAAASTGPEKRILDLHLPHKNNFIPSALEVEKKVITQPALTPRLLRNDLQARTWWKKDDTFWVPKANVIAILKNPIVNASAENAVKARLFAALVRDALEEYSYDADLAGLQYSVSVDSRGLLLEVSGYNDKLPVLLQYVATTMRDLHIKEDRFEVVRERLARNYYNKQYEAPYFQFRGYFNALMSEKSYPIEELAAELPITTCEAVRQFQQQILSQMHIEILVLGNLQRGEAQQLTEVLETTFKPRVLPRDQWPIIRSNLLPSGSSYVYNKTLKDPANVNNCVATWLYMGDRGDPLARAKALLMGQIGQEPGFDQLRTKEQLGYVVFSGYRAHLTSVGHWTLVQSERTADYLDSRIEAFLTKLGEILKDMTDKEFEDHKRSLTVSLLEKWQNLSEEFASHWNHISSEYYNFERAHTDAATLKQITKADMKEVYDKYINPSSTQRARISVHLHAQGAGELDTKIINLLLEHGLEDVPTDQRQSLDLLELFLGEEAKVPKEKQDGILSQAKELGLKRVASEDEPGQLNGLSALQPQSIDDVLSFKASLMVSPGARPVRPLSDYEDLDAKL